MKDAISSACQRLDLSPQMEQAYQSVFSKCVDWCRLSNDLEANAGIEEYAIAQTLHQRGFLDERRTALWRDGRCVGKRVEHKQAAALSGAT